MYNRYDILYIHIVCADVKCKTNGGKHCTTAAAVRMQNKKTYILLLSNNMYCTFVKQQRRQAKYRRNYVLFLLIHYGRL